MQLGLAEAWASGLSALVSGLLILAFAGGLALFLAGLLQSSTGSVRPSLFHYLQILTNASQDLRKPDTPPAGVDPLTFMTWPYVGFVLAFLPFVVLPFADNTAAFIASVAALLMLAFLLTLNIGLVWSGTSERSVPHLLWTVPLVFSVLVPCTLAGTMNLNLLARNQGGGLWNWFLFNDPFTFSAFVLFIVAAVLRFAPEEKTSISTRVIDGSALLACSGLATLLFLGGWNLGFTPDLAVILPVIGNLINLVVFLTKTLLVMMGLVLLRSKLPHVLREPNLTLLLLLSWGLLVGLGFWQVYCRPLLGSTFRYFLCLGSILGLAWFLYRSRDTRVQTIASQGTPPAN